MSVQPQPRLLGICGCIEVAPLHLPGVPSELWVGVMEQKPLKTPQILLFSPPACQESRSGDRMREHWGGTSQEGGVGWRQRSPVLVKTVLNCGKNGKEKKHSDRHLLSEAVPALPLLLCRPHVVSPSPGVTSSADLWLSSSEFGPGTMDPWCSAVPAGSCSTQGASLSTGVIPAASYSPALL